MSKQTTVNFGGGGHCILPQLREHSNAQAITQQTEAPSKHRGKAGSPHSRRPAVVPPHLKHERVRCVDVVGDVALGGRLQTQLAVGGHGVVHEHHGARQLPIVQHLHGRGTSRLTPPRLDTLPPLFGRESCTALLQALPDIGTKATHSDIPGKRTPKIWR